MLRGQGILCLSSIDWGFLWQGHQQIMATLARAGNRVVFVESTGVRRATFRDLRRMRLRLRNRRGWAGTREELPGLVVHSPVVLPFPYSRLALAANGPMLVREVRQCLDGIGIERPIVWSFLPTPLSYRLAAAVKARLTIYHCVDDFRSSSTAAAQIRASESRWFNDADLVFVTSQRLRHRAEAHSSRVHLFPSGVDYERFERARKGDSGEPDDLAACQRPRVVYLGGLHRWLDQELLIDVASRLPECSFVLIGPLQTDVTALAATENIHVLGARGHEVVPRYLKACDAAIVPYRLVDYTHHVYPAKLNEYLAMGLPVVATALDEVRRFNDQHSEVIAIGDGGDAFASRIRSALRSARDPGARARRIEVARINSWDTRIDGMSSLIESALAARAGDHRAPARWRRASRALQ